MKINEVDINSEQIREILEKQPNVILKWGTTVICLVVFFMFVTTWIIKYPDIVESQVVITTQIPPQKEYAKKTGKLETIFVKENTLVKPNEPLAIIENTANHKDVYHLKAIMDTIQRDNSVFRFPIDQLPILALGDIETEFAIFENNYTNYILNKELQPYSNEAEANRLSISELNTRLHSLQSQKEINKVELSFKRKDLERNTLLLEKHVISTQEYENKLLEYKQAERNYKDFESSISQVRERVNNAFKTSKGSEINRIKEEMILLKRVIQSFNQLKKSIREWENLYVLKSNIIGEVSFFNVWNSNQMVSQGDLVLTIIPQQNSSFVAKLETPVHNSGKVKIGQKVNIKLDNYPNAEFGILIGRVNKISLMPNEGGVYVIDVELPQKLITSYNKTIDFKQEMSGVAEIITEDLRLIDRVFYQIRKIFNP